MFRKKPCREHTPIVTRSSIDPLPPHTRRVVLRCSVCRKSLGVRTMHSAAVQNIDMVPMMPPEPEGRPA